VTLSVTAIPRLRDCGARVFYAACRRMVFGLSSSKPLRLTSDHLPSRLIYHNQLSMKGRNNLEAMKPGRNAEGRKRGIKFSFLVSLFVS
jgi:hypothetical protein